MIENTSLETFWISFPQETYFLVGIGVTARSLEDAFGLIREYGFQDWCEKAREIRIARGVRIQDLDAGHIVPNMGPMQFRGVWYPNANIGWAAPRERQFKRLDDRDD